jgi:hypothetical protein
MLIRTARAAIIEDGHGAGEGERNRSGVTTSGPLDRGEPHGHLTQGLIRALPLTVGSAIAFLLHRASETCAGSPALYVGNGGGVVSAWS